MNTRAPKERFSAKQITAGCTIMGTLCLLGGIPPLKLWPLSWFALTPFFYLTYRIDLPKKSLPLATLAVGFVFYTFGLSWIRVYEPLVYAILLLIVFPFFTLFFILYRFLTQKLSSGAWIIMLAPALWIFLLKLFSYTRIGSMAFEAIHYGPLPFLQITSLFGLYALTGVIVGLNASIAYMRVQNQSFGFKMTCVFLALLMGFFLWGSFRLITNPEVTHPSNASKTIQTAVIQHNLSLDLKWRFEHPDIIDDTYRDMALQAQMENPDLTVFPLYGFTSDIRQNPGPFQSIARETHSYLLLASYVSDLAEDVFYDMSFLFAPSGNIENTYHAYAAPPFRTFSEVTAKNYQVMKSSLGVFGIHLCYESGLSRITRKAVNQGAELLISLSNPGHFNNSHLPYYHLMQDRLRSLESNRYLIRVASNGISAMIDPYGRVLAQTQLDEQEILYLQAVKISKKSFYHTLPEILPILSLLLLLIGIGKQFKKT